MQLGGPALAIKTVSQFTGLPINHVAVVDLASFKDADRRARRSHDQRARSRSSPTASTVPYKTQARCNQWHGWRFAKGRAAHERPARARLLADPREPAQPGATPTSPAAARQQAVLQAVASKLASLGTAVRLPFIGGDLLKPLATDLSAGQFLQLGWVKFRAPGGRVLHCRLGGSASSVGGESVIVSTRGELRRGADGDRGLRRAAAAARVGARTGRAAWSAASASANRARRRNASYPDEGQSPEPPPWLEPSSRSVTRGARERAGTVTFRRASTSSRRRRAGAAVRGGGRRGRFGRGRSDDEEDDDESDESLPAAARLPEPLP